jgi:hypothetical protein
VTLHHLTRRWSESRGRGIAHLVLVRRMKRCLVVITLSALVAGYSFARITRAWTHEDLLKESDFVGLLEPVSNKATTDDFSIKLSDGTKVHYTGIDTHFRVIAALKSSGATEKAHSASLFRRADGSASRQRPLPYFLPDSGR